MPNVRFRAFAGVAFALLASGAAIGAQPGGLTPDMPAHFAPKTDSFDYVRREVMIPMRDGVRLHTVLIVPKGASRAPIMLDRTPYSANETLPTGSAHMAMTVPRTFEVMAEEGYIIAVQDVRGKYGSEGEYVNERPLRGPDNPTSVDHATDAYDTIDWLVKHTPESNGRVGMIGTSYDGMMVLMAMDEPHPALKAAVPINPVGNTWMGDDDFHGGAFRLIGYDYYYSQDTERGSGDDLWRRAYDDYDTFLRAGSASDFTREYGSIRSASRRSWPRTRPTTPIGGPRRWRRSWRTGRTRSPPCSSRASGIRRTSTAPWRSGRPRARSTRWARTGW